MIDAINGLKTKLFTASLGIGLASTIGLIVPNQTAKEISKLGLGIGLAGLVFTEISSSKSFSEIEKVRKNLEGELSVKDVEAEKVRKSLEGELSVKGTEIINLNHEIEKKVKELNQAQSTQQELLKVIESLQSTVRERDLEIENCKQAAYNLNLKLVEVTNFSATETRQIVRKTYERAVKQVEALVNALIRNFSEVSEDLEKILTDVDSFKTRYLNAVNQYEELNSLDDLLNEGLEIQEKIINRAFEFKIKAQTIVIRHYSYLAQQSVPVEVYENDLEFLAKDANQKIKLGQAEVAIQWVESNNEHVQRYETEFKDTLTLAQYLNEKIAKLEDEISTLNQKLAKAERPFLLQGDVEQVRIINDISIYYLEFGYKLDCLDWEQTDTGYSLMFSTSRNGDRFISPEMLNNKEMGFPEKLKQLCNSLNTPKFERSERGGCWHLDVQKWHPVKNKAAEKDISRLWVPADKFEKIVRHWSRVRITGGSETGKSPTAENLAIIILKNRPGTVRLFNPQDDSTKNNWTIPSEGTSHKESEKAIKALADKLDARANGQELQKQFELWIFDEIDSTMTKAKSNKKAIGENIKFIMKQASHQELGSIFIGQNANAKEYPGMDRSDWNSAVNLHIGNNIYDALSNSNLFTNDQANKLKERAEKLIDYCINKNEELGLDKTDPGAYRVALVVEPEKRPYFAEIPRLDSYAYDDLELVHPLTSADGIQVASTASKMASEVSNPDSNVASQMASTDYVGVKCPKCNEGVLSGVKKNRGVNYYVCDSCQKSTSENRLKGM